MVQNGESEVEMELNDTDESDEDSDEDVCQEVDKENQPPMDCPADNYVDIEPKTNKHTMPRDRYRWLKKDFISPNTDFSGPDITGDDISLHTPLEYFQKFVSEDMVEALTQNTNEYSFQAHGTSINTTAKEIEKMLGMYLKMGLVQMAGTRMYWETETRYSPVADVMPRNRFQSLLTSLHFVNNMTVSETEKKDKLWKLRPWLDSFREKCLQVVPEEHNSVDEMMIPFKDTLVSSFAGPEPVQKIQRWDKAHRTYIEVERPYIVGAYNKYMGGVDLLDSFTAKYKFPIKSRRWYMYIFWHTIILAVVNAWLLYKRDCKALKMSSKETMNRRQFQAQLASSLILVNAPLQTPKRGRPSSGKGSPATQTVTSGSPLNAQKRPSKRCAHLPLDVRKDLVAHFPRKTGRGRCRHCNKGYTNTQCRKCDESVKPVFSVAEADDTAQRRALVCRQTLYTCLEVGLRLLAPIMPFVTEELFQRLPRRLALDSPASIAVTPYPETDEFCWQSDEVDRQMEFVMTIVKTIRSLRADYNLTKTRADCYLQCIDLATVSLVQKYSLQIQTLSYSQTVNAVTPDQAVPEGCAVAIASDRCTINLVLKGVIDVEKEVAKLTTKKGELEKQMEKLREKMAKNDYKEKVPVKVQEQDAEKLRQSQTELEKVTEAIDNFKKMM
ncbi:Valine--tRNA ligase [Merluccius polli]|uniref:Valine--tRNA ligase n=1 Tax=Merluccius polli TaxID=89951 RepID=A0AA47P7Z7_MERPO|nr:Valine--tRNA ligase [Merluccius polli]